MTARYWAESRTHEDAPASITDPGRRREWANGWNAAVKESDDQIMAIIREAAELPPLPDTGS